MLLRVVSMLTKLRRRNHELLEERAVHGDYDSDDDYDNDNEEDGKTQPEHATDG